MKFASLTIYNYICSNKSFALCPFISYIMKKVYFSLLFLGCAVGAFAQDSPPQSVYSLDDLLYIAQSSSPSALIAKHTYRSSYWRYNSYRAELLPSLNLSANLGEYNRSISSVTDTTGAQFYINNNYLRNGLTLSLDQNIAPTGGMLSLYTQLNRLDQFSPKSDISYNSQPLSLTYLQPIGGYNTLKWQKKMEPLRFDISKRSYLEQMEYITINTTRLFFNLLLQQRNYEAAQKNYDNTEALYKVTEQRAAIGAMFKNDVLQMKVGLLNASLSINDAKLAMDEARSALCSYLGIDRNSDFSLDVPDMVTSLSMDFNEVLDYSYKNGTINMRQELSTIEAESAIAEAKARRGISANLRFTFGLSQSGADVGDAYKNLKDQEITGLSLSIPIMDWGRGKGRVKMAQSQADVIAAQVDQAFKDHEQNVFLNVMHFNNLVYQCAISKEVALIAQERYQICLDQYANASLSVTELNTAQTEKDNADSRYVRDLQQYWSYYFEIRRLCLYDFITRKDISTTFDQLVE